MAINCYTGLMGSGKSYEVVSSVILPAVLDGRRVVTNIDGINPDLIYDYLVEKKKGIRENLGEIVSFKNEDILKPEFFPDEDRPDQASVVKGGDLVCVDECWNFWGQEHKISEEHMRFFRMHRHYTDPDTGTSCDVALIIQDLGTLHRKLRAVIEMTTRTVKLKALGMPTQYRIELYETNKISKKTHLDTYNKSYQKHIFPLYKSYAAGAGKEKAIDKRQNILRNPRLWIVTALTVAALYFAVSTVLRFFSPTDKTKAAELVKTPSGAANPPGAPHAGAVAQKPPQPGFSEVWRVVGRFVVGGQLWVVVSNTSGKLRIESPSNFHGDGYAVIGEIDGERVTVWSGAPGVGVFSTEARK